MGIAQPAWLSVLNSNIDATQFIENLFVTEPFTEGSTASGRTDSGIGTSNTRFNGSLNNDHLGSDIRDRAVELDHVNIQSDIDDTETRNTHEFTSR